MFNRTFDFGEPYSGLCPICGMGTAPGGHSYYLDHMWGFMPADARSPAHTVAVCIRKESTQCPENTPRST